MRTFLSASLLTAVACLALSGCTTPADDAAPLVDVDGAPFAVSFEGTTSQGGCVFVADLGQCEFPNDAHLDIAPLGNASALRATGNVTWAADTPATETLDVYLLVLENGTWNWYPDFPDVYATSPVAFDWDVATILAAHNLTGLPVAVGVGESNPLLQSMCVPAPAPMTPCAFTYAAIGQAFVLEATVTPAPATTPAANPTA